MGELGKKVPAEMMEKVGTLIGRLAEEGVGKNAPKVGEQAPSFSLQNFDGKTISLRHLLEAGPVVTVFYRGEWCPFCDLTLRAFQRALPEIISRGASLVAISPQTSEHSRSTSENRSLSFDVLCDSDNRAAKEFGLVFALNPAEQELHKAFEANLPEINGMASWELPVPAIFVIDRTGRIAWSHVDSNYTSRGEPADVIHALDGIRQAH